MKILFMGSTKAAWHCLNELINIGEDVVGICSISRKFDISYSKNPVTNSNFTDFSIIAKERKIPLLIIDTQVKQKEYLEIIERFKPDLIFVTGWYFNIPSAVLEVAPFGTIGIHDSLLPKYRGGAPKTWAIINGEKQSGTTLFYLDKGVDSGDIIGQKPYNIEFNDTIQDIINKATGAACNLIKTYIPLIKNKQAPRIKQNETEATYFPQRSPEDGIIDWNKPAIEIYNWIRAQTKPYPGAFTYLEGQKIILWKSKLESILDPNGYAGKVIYSTNNNKNSIRVCCGDNHLLTIHEYEKPII